MWKTSRYIKPLPLYKSVPVVLSLSTKPLIAHLTPLFSRAIDIGFRWVAPKMMDNNEFIDFQSLSGLVPKKVQISDLLRVTMNIYRTVRSETKHRKCVRVTLVRTRFHAGSCVLHPSWFARFSELRKSPQPIAGVERLSIHCIVRLVSSWSFYNNTLYLLFLNRLELNLKKTKQGPHVELYSVELVLVNDVPKYHSLMNHMGKNHSYVVDGGLAVVDVVLRIPTKDPHHKTLVVAWSSQSFFFLPVFLEIW
ncbi:hypothetical protein J6590_004810 [Homalodisca vitripennis]|nr:hypothetical protein J6590_004810 [Homalodisca vitripennis]